MYELIRRINWRYVCLWLITIATLVVFLGRLFFVQIVEHDSYVSEANEMRIKQRELIAKRGQIYMMSGEDDVVPVVMNERTWTIFVDPSFVDDKDKVQIN